MIHVYLFLQLFAHDKYSIYVDFLILFVALRRSFQSSR